MIMLFVLLVRMVIKKVAEWLWKVCHIKQSTMLHAAYDYAFRGLVVMVIKGSGILWKVCPDLEQSTMLHARDDYVLFGLSEWSFDIAEVVMGL